MTKLLERAFAKAAELPQAEQDLIARSLLADLEAEEKWDEAFGDSEDELALLADEALEEHKNGQTRKLDDTL